MRLKSIFLLLLTLDIGVPPLLAADETKESIVLERADGNTTNHVHLDDYSRIDLRQNGYTLVSNNEEKNDIGLGYEEFPKFYVENRDAAAPTLQGEAPKEEAQSLVVEHWYGVDNYHVHTDDYNRINLGTENYTLVSNSPSDPKKPNITLNYDTYPRFWMEDVATDIPTAVEAIKAEVAAPSLSYCSELQELRSTAQDAIAVAVYDLTGKLLLQGEVSASASLPVGSLARGIYIAASLDASVPTTIKFAVR